MKIVSCRCESCRRACSHKPGWFLPGEVEKAAKFMKISTEAFFKKYLAVDWWCGDPDIYLIAPAILGAIPGKEYPLDPQGKCVFLNDEEECMIYPVRPFECRIYLHSDKHDVVQERHRQTAIAWGKEIHQKWVASLLGRKPGNSLSGIKEAIGLLDGLLGK